MPVSIGSKVLGKPAVIVERPGKGHPSSTENPQAITTLFQPILTEEPMALPPPPLAKAKWGSEFTQGPCQEAGETEGQAGSQDFFTPLGW